MAPLDLQIPGIFLPEFPAKGWQGAMATLVVDNGAGILKAGLLPANLDAAAAELAASPVRLANATAKSRLEKKFFVVC